MDIFDLLSLVLAIAFLTAGFFPQRIGNMEKYKKALTLWMVALILYFPVSAIFGIGVYLSLVARPLGFILSLLSLRQLCLALALHPDGRKKDDANG
jgi:hypothetical protein